LIGLTASEKSSKSSFDVAGCAIRFIRSLAGIDE
jgi:hypothetical protein